MFKKYRRYAYLEPYICASMIQLQPMISKIKKHNIKQDGVGFSSSKPGKRFLIVEDDDAIAQTIVSELEDNGYVVKTAAHPEAAKKIASLFLPDVYIIDYYLPQQDGISLKQELEKIKQAHNAAYVLMSAYSHVKHLAQTNNIDYLEKPFHVDELLSIAKKTGLQVRNEDEFPSQFVEKTLKKEEQGILFDLLDFIKHSPF